MIPRCQTFLELHNSFIPESLDGTCQSLRVFNAMMIANQIKLNFRELKQMLSGTIEMKNLV